MITKGSKGQAVECIQKVLAAHGYDVGNIDGIFGNRTFIALQEFQGGHIGPDKRPLSPSGMVDANTEWALNNPSGDPQRSHIDPLIPSELTPKRERFLEFVVHKYRTGIREIPDGSNGGDGVDEITGGRRAAWCMRFVWWALRRCNEEPFGEDVWQCLRARNIAKKGGWWRPKESYSPKPGDIMIMLYSDKGGRLTGSGHTGIVLDTGPGYIITIEGNCGNRVACKRRAIGQTTLKGFINFWDENEQPTKWVSGSKVGDSKKESTR